MYEPLDLRERRVETGPVSDALPGPVPSGTDEYVVEWQLERTTPDARPPARLSA